MTEKIEPAVGQVWADNDWRQDGRQVRIDSLNETHADVTVVANCHGRRTGQRTRIRLDRLRPTSTGYRLVSP